MNSHTHIDILQQQIDQLERYKESESLLFDIWLEIAGSTSTSPVISHATHDRLSKHLFGNNIP